MKPNHSAVSTTARPDWTHVLASKIKIKLTFKYLNSQIVTSLVSCNEKIIVEGKNKIHRGFQEET